MKDIACSYLGTMSFPITTDVINSLLYFASGKLKKVVALHSSADLPTLTGHVMHITMYKEELQALFIIMYM